MITLSVGRYENGVGGEDCLDYDAALILANFSFLVPPESEARGLIATALDRDAALVRGQRNPDGGFPSHRRPEKYAFGTKTTVVEVGGSNMWASYSRLMTLAFAAEVAGKSDNAATPFLPRSCSKTLVGCVVLRKRGGRSTPSVNARRSSLLLLCSY